MNTRVVVTGLGPITSIGIGKDEYWQGLCSGKIGIDRISAFDATNFSSQIAAEVKNFDPGAYMGKKEIRHMDRFVQFAVAGSIIAVHDAGLDMEKENLERIGVLIGSGIGGISTLEREHTALMEKGPSRISPFLIPMLIVNMASGCVSIMLKIKGPNTAVATACATGTHAIGDAFKIIQRGDADVMVTGGAEASITPLAVGGFCAARALAGRNGEPKKASRPFDKMRDGFIMGEGTGIVILESLEHAVQRGAHIYAEIIGYAMTGDASHMTAPDPNAEQSTRAIVLALKDAGVKPEEVDHVNAHGTSTSLNDKCETMAIKNVFGKHAYEIPVSATKSMTGHLLGAAGAIELIATALSVENNIVPPTMNYEYPDPDCDLDYVPNKMRQAKVDIAISNSFAFGGHNTTLVVRKFR
jgi:3-oxoacyl-[acyl-carrier-protein] synthase II